MSNRILSRILNPIFSRFSKKFSNNRIYLDYASLTPIDPRVMIEMEKYSSNNYANPSSFYKEGVAAKKALADGRVKVSGFIHANPNEITFTSGGTESNNLAVIGSVEALHEKGVAYEDMHIIVSAIEHSSVRECANYLNGKGVEVDSISVDEFGIISLEELKKKIRSNTVIVSIMTVNNEIGSIQPIKEIVKVIRDVRKKNGERRMEKGEWKNEKGERGIKNDKPNHFDFQSFEYPIFHTDASQAALYEDLSIEKMGVDLLTLDGTKVYGPRGVGVLYVRKDTPLIPIIYGGGQESGRRSGTENLPAIMGLAKALDITSAEKEKETARITKLKKYLVDQLKVIRSDIKVNGGQSDPVVVSESNSNPNLNKRTVPAITQSPHILNVFIPGIDNEFFVLQLDAKGIACSTKSSCLRDEDESYVLKSIGADSKRSVRFSFGRWTTMRELRKALKIIGNSLESLQFTMKSD